jgi:DNA-binding response OmpR family regulator
MREAAEDLRGLGLEPVESGEAETAVQLLLGEDAPDLAVVDWELPGVGGPEVCRQVRARRHSGPPYIILIAPTKEQVGEAFAAGADDCFAVGAGDHELQARLFAARRLAALSTHSSGWQAAPPAGGPARPRSPRPYPPHVC